jgi:calcium-dependent protein kinase
MPLNSLLIIRVPCLCRMVGTPYYIAPEVLNQSESTFSAKGYTNACDVWGLGVITYMLLSGTPPFKGKRDQEVLQAVKRGKYTLSGPKWENISDEAKDFIRHLLIYNPAKRMKAEQALKHPWMQKAKLREAAAKVIDPEVLASLRDFSKFSSFKRAALEAIAFSMSAQSISHLREQFTTLDKDQSGFVSPLEFIELLTANGVSRVSREAVAMRQTSA